MLTNFGIGAIVSRIRSSYSLAAPSFTNFGFERTLAIYDSSVVLVQKFSWWTRRTNEENFTSAKPVSDLREFHGNFSVTFSTLHICYEGVSNFSDAVPICDSASRRSVNRALQASMKGCEKPLYCRLNRRFTLLNS